LRDYYRDAAALGGHTPHRLDQAFSFHSRFAASGSMLR
jgi:succinyl-CoA:acetate CoA-transferase